MKKICVDPDKVCPSTTSTVCSGHGTCQLFDIGGNTVTSCGERNVHCLAKCVCQGGYGGVSCSLSPTDLIAQENARVSMCNAVLVTAKQLTPSAKLVDKLVSTVLSAYDPYVVRSTQGINNCSKVLLTIGQLASKGYMTGTLAHTPTDYAELITLFTASLSTVATNAAQATTTTTTTTKRALIETEILSTTSTYDMETHIDHGLTSAVYVKDAKKATTNTLSNNLQSATKSLVTGTQTSMVAGQSPVSVTSSSGVKVTAQNTLASDLNNAKISPPQTQEEQAYSVPNPTISVPGRCVTKRYPWRGGTLAHHLQTFVNNSFFSLPSSIRKWDVGLQFWWRI